MNDYIIKIILALIPAIGAILTGFLVPWLRAKVGTEKLNQYMVWAKQAVQYAEMAYPGSDTGKLKKECVYNYMSGLLSGALTPEQIDILIESAVKELKLAEAAYV